MNRVRFAPSPTGYLHVGGARTLLFNWLFARRSGGKLVLRVEDTDQARSTPEFEKMVLADVEDLKMSGDESPVVSGPFPPYRQSERLSIYAKYAKQLLQEGKAYYCFCSDDLLTQKREVAMKLGRTPHYDGTCARLTPATALARVAAGEKAGLRFKAYQRDTILKDVVRGEVNFKEGMVGDFLVTRTPGAGEGEIAQGIGMPVYNFCCVIDDHEMQMTHVIRGEDHLSNSARQLMIYEAFGWTPPIFAHIAMVLGADRQKLSKRNGDVSVRDYLQKGYLQEALLNFLSLLGWGPPAGYKPVSGHPEILSRNEMTEIFDLADLHKAPAVFDLQKLNWMNGYYIRMLPVSEIAQRARPFFETAGMDLSRIKSPEWFDAVIEAVRADVSLLNELPVAARLFFEEQPVLSEAGRTLLADPATHPVVNALLAEIESMSGEFDSEQVDALQKKVGVVSGCKGKGLFMPIRAAITGSGHGPELKKVLPLLGREAVLLRVRQIKSEAGIG